MPPRTTVAALLALAAPTTAQAIITRDDVPDAEYVVPDGEQPGLVDLFGPGDCIGTLVAPSWLLTVAHCAQDLDPGASLPVDGVDHAVAEVVLHPQWKRFPYDIALIRFEVPVDGVDPLPLYRERDELGQTLTLYGRGVHGTGLVGERGATDDGQLRHATNVITDATEQWLEVYFEPPDDPAVTPLEGVGAAGDSGGPSFVDTADGRLLVGLNSWGDAHPYADVGKYGAWDYQTRVSSFVGWIDGVVGTPSDTDPEPSHGAPRGCGCQDAPAGGVGGWVVLLVLALTSAADRRCAAASSPSPEAARRSAAPTP